MLHLKRIIFSHNCKSRSFSTGIEWTSKVGLEIHAQVSSESKLFSQASTAAGDREPNSSVDLFDIALPGVLPRLNRKCVEYGLLTAMATHSKINPVSYFDRKHYFYPDLPAGYQITQKRVPLAQDGRVEFKLQKSPKGVKTTSTVRIDRIQLEHDSAKILLGKSNETLLDYNRSGVGLMEIVTAPDIKDGEEAAAFINELLLLLKEIRVCESWMEPGSFRVDANVSVHRNNQPSVKVEVKNISSVKFVKKAISYEISRQRKLYEKGEEVVEETRMYDTARSVTHATREKGGSSDYRFIPEPDLPPIWVIDSENEGFHKVAPSELENCIDLAEVRTQLRELPNAKRRRLSETYGLREDQIENLMVSPNMLEYLEKTARLVPNISPIETINWMDRMVGLLANRDLTIKDSVVSPEALHSLMQLLYLDKKITKHTLGTVLKTITEGDDRTPDTIVKEEGLCKMDGREELLEVVRGILSDDPDLVTSLTRNKKKLIQLVNGRVMARTNGRADPVASQQVVSDYFE